MSFELIEEPERERKLVEGMIRRFGSNPEHNFRYFLQQEEEKGEKCVFVRNGKYGLQTVYTAAQKKWRMVGTPIAPREKQTELLRDALDFLSEKGRLRKLVAEFEKGAKKKVDAALAGRYTVHAPSCVLYWPVFDMKAWSGDKLKGREWKKIRNMLNRVKRSHKIRMIDSANADRRELKDIVMKWARLRSQTGFGIDRKYSNKAYCESYLNLIDRDFAGCKFAKTLVIDGKSATITAGWEIPNSNGAYYSAIGIYDQSIPQLGVYVNWKDLVMLKKAGYSSVDFGGSPKSLLQFKKKFRPSSIYTTYIYSITKK